METVILIIHLLLALSIIFLVLMQRSEGGGLTSSMSGGAGNFASPKSTANALTRATAVCFALFIVTSITLAILANTHTSSSDILSKLDASAAQQTTGSDTEKSDDKVNAEEKTDEKTKPKAPVPGAQ